MERYDYLDDFWCIFFKGKGMPTILLRFLVDPKTMGKQRHPPIFPRKLPARSLPQRCWPWCVPKAWYGNLEEFDCVQWMSFFFIFFSYLRLRDNFFLENLWWIRDFLFYISIPDDKRVGIICKNQASTWQFCWWPWDGEFTWPVTMASNDWR